MRTSKHGRGKHPGEALRMNIGKMWDAGATQLEIADALQVSSPAVRYHLQRLGVPPDQQHKPHPLVRGKRICVQCKINKELTLYPTPRHAICTTCIRQNSSKKK